MHPNNYQGVQRGLLWSVDRRGFWLEVLRCTLWEGDWALFVRSMLGRGFIENSSNWGRERQALVLKESKDATALKSQSTQQFDRFGNSSLICASLFKGFACLFSYVPRSYQYLYRDRPTVTQRCLSTSLAMMRIRIQI